MAKSKTAGWEGKMVAGRSSTALDRGTVDRGGDEKKGTTSRLMGMGSNDVTNRAARSPDIAHKSLQDDKLPPNRKDKGGWK